MRPISRRWVLGLATIAMLLALPGTALADCKGPGCEPTPTVEAGTIGGTVLILAVFVGIMGLGAARRS